MPHYLPPLAQSQSEPKSDAEAVLLACWAHALWQAGFSWQWETLADLLRGHERQVTSIPQLDPYAPRTDVRYVGPLPWAAGSQTPTPAEQGWTRQGGEVIAYLRLQTPQLGGILSALQRWGRPTLAVVPGIGPDRMGGESLHVTGEPVDLGTLLPRARLFITNGGIHGVGQAVAAGVPLLVAPMQVEQALTAARVVRQGWGRCWMPGVDAIADLQLK